MCATLFTSLSWKTRILTPGWVWFSRLLSYSGNETNIKHSLTPFWDVPLQIMELHLVALCRESHNSSSWPYSWASLSPYVLCTPPLKSLQASDGEPACMSAYVPHTLRAADRAVYAKSAEAFNISCTDCVSVRVPTWHMPFPAEESKTHFPLWNAQTVSGCW